MKIRMLLPLLVMCLAPTAFAQNTHPLAEVFGGFSYVRVDSDERDARNLFGWNGSLSLNATKSFGFTVDASGHYQDNVGLRSRFITILAGPRYTARNEHATTFVHALFGGSHNHESFNSLGTSFTSHANAFAMALGGGVDVNVSPHFGVRVFQAEYLLTKFDTAPSGKQLQHNARVGVGVVFKFADRKD